MDSQGAKSVMSNDMQELTEGKEDISNRARGLKASITNANTSDAKKEENKQKLEELGGEQAFYGKNGDDQPASKNAEEKLEGSRAM